MTATDPLSRLCFVDRSRFAVLILAIYTFTCHGVAFAERPAEDGASSSPSSAATPAPTPLPAQHATVEVTGRRALKDLAAAGDYAENLVGIADAASEGTVTAAQIQSRPLSRAGDLLETVPGVVISQHSGEGKANQYYLRGFNLDHGTDLSSSVAGVPVNMPTHAHGQGYSDLNFVIPELVESLQYRKGPYTAEDGDFAAAGSARVNYVTSLPKGIVELAGGSFGFQRALVAESFRVGGGDLLGAFEYHTNDGPWENPDRYRRLNGLVSYSTGTARSSFTLTALSYDGTWNSTDQIPERAVEGGLVSRFGALDATDGGRTHRRSLSATFSHSDEDGGSAWKATAYVLDYGLNLFSNFTYYLEDPVNGDQFEQEDKRVVSGLRVSRQTSGKLLGKDIENVVGIDVRNDNIASVGLFHTRARERLSTVRDDHVVQTSSALFGQSTLVLSGFLRTVVGLRADLYRFKVDSDNPLNSGTETSGLLSPKLTVVLGPWKRTELYLNAGYGFHSNDGRGSTIRVEPKSGETAERVNPLVRAKGAEVGLRSGLAPGVETTISAWGLDIDSELLFVGDAGTTEASRPSRRVGLDATIVGRPLPRVLVDAQLALTRARFRDADPSGDHIPGALATVVAAGVTYDAGSGLSGALRLRHLGSRPLIEDASVTSRSSTVLNAQLGYVFEEWVFEEWRPNLRLTLDIANLLNSKVSDIDYFYASRLPGEHEGGTDDIHFHPAEPFSVRLAIRASF